MFAEVGMRTSPVFASIALEVGNGGKQRLRNPAIYLYVLSGPVEMVSESLMVQMVHRAPILLTFHNVGRSFPK